MNRKQRPRFLALLLTVIMLLTVAGCGSSKGDQQDSMDTTDATDTNPASTGEGVNAKTSVTLATSGEPYRFFALSDEGCAGDDNLVLSNVYDCLTFLEADGSISEGLAEKWEVSEDGLCYTFHLREGVKFHNGYDFTAEDVKFTFDKGFAGPLGSALFVNYDRCEIVDDYTVNIYLTAPYAGFVYGVASRLGGICSKAYYDEVGDEGYMKAPIGTGPYKFVEAVSGERVVMEANNDYWRGKPAIQEVVIQIVSDVSTQIIGLENGDYDAVRNPSIDTCMQLEGNDDIAWNRTDSTGRITLYLAAWGGRIGENKDFRKAIQAGINKEEVNIGTNSGYATILDIDMCPMYGGYPTEGIDKVEYDRDQAIAYLESSPYNGESFEILCKSGTTFETAAKIIQAQLIDIGIDAKVTAVDNTTYSELEVSGNFDAIIREQLSSMVDADGASTYFNTTPGFTYTANCKYPLADEIYPLFVEGRAAQGEARIPYYTEACNIITEEAYLVPLYNGIIAVAYNADLKGVEAHCLGTYNFYHWSW